MIGISTDELFRSPGQIKVLRVLWRSGPPLSGRQVQRLSGLANLAAMRSLEKLVNLGIVTCRRAGRAYQYDLKREHWTVATLVSPLFENEDKFLEALICELDRGLAGECLSAYLYGSAVSPAPGPAGDLDLFLVLEDEKRRIAFEMDVFPKLGGKISRRFGLFLEPKIAIRSELSRRSLKPVLESVVREGRKIRGKNLRDLMKK
jgi:predicted nucleotidyltransferase